VSGGASIALRPDTKGDPEVPAFRRSQADLLEKRRDQIDGMLSLVLWLELPLLIGWVFVRLGGVVEGWMLFKYVASTPPIIALPLFLYRYTALRLHSGILGDVPEVSLMMKEAPLLPPATLHWMAARRRIWSRLFRSMVWLAAESILIGVFYFWHQHGSNLAANLAFAAMACVPVTLILILLRSTDFVLASRHLSPARNQSAATPAQA